MASRRLAVCKKLFGLQKLYRSNDSSPDLAQTAAFQSVLTCSYVHDIYTNIIGTIIRPPVNDFHPGAVFVQEKKPFPPGIPAKKHTEHSPMGVFRFIIA